MKRASKHEVLEASYVVLAVCAALPGCLGEGSTIVAGKLRRTWGYGVCVGGLGGDLTFGHEQVVKFELSFGNWVCGQQCAL